MVEAEMGFWEVVDDPNALEPKVSVLDEAESADAEIELAKSEEYISPQMLLKKQAEKKKTDSSKFEPITHEQYERMRRKAKSPIWSMLSVLLGGLASIPIATLLIWHVLGKDPLQMGPVVARYAPWIVPTRFQPYDFDEDIQRPEPPSGASGFRRFDNVMNSSTDFSATSGSPSDSEPFAVGSSSETTSSAQSRPFRSRDHSAPQAMPDSSDSSVEEPLNNESTAESPLATAPPSNDVFSVINQVKKDLEAWNERGEDRELQKKLAFQTYSSLSSLALASNQLPLASPIRRLVRTELHSVGQQVAQHLDIQQLIQSGSRFWLTSHQEDLIGLAIVISVARATEADNVWHITPATSFGEESIQITVPKEILPSLSEGQNILAIGCLARAKSAAKAEPLELASKSTSMLTANYVYVLKP